MAIVQKKNGYSSDKNIGLSEKNGYSSDKTSYSSE